MNIQKELQVIGEYPALSPVLGGEASRPCYSTPITPKENYMRALRGEELWTPVSSQDVTFSPRIIPDSVARGFVVDANPIDNAVEAGGPDMFGVVWEWVPQVQGSMVRAEGQQMLGDISAWESVLHFPDPARWDWEGSASANEKYLRDELVTQVWFQNGLFERLVSLMGFGEAAVALIDDDQKPHVHAFFERLCALYEDIFSRFKKYYGADALFFHDDWGGQSAPFFSLDTVNEMLLPYLKRLVAYVHGLGMAFEFHSCGNIGMLVPAMIEAGVDIWSGQRINDHLALLEKYAEALRMDVMPDMEFGKSYSSEESADIAEEYLDTYGPWLKYIRVLNLNPDEEGREKLFKTIYERSREKLTR